MEQSLYIHGVSLFEDARSKQRMFSPYVDNWADCPLYERLVEQDNSGCINQSPTHDILYLKHSLKTSLTERASRKHSERHWVSWSVHSCTVMQAMTDNDYKQLNLKSFPPRCNIRPAHVVLCENDISLRVYTKQVYYTA